MKGEALDAWKRIAPILADLGLMSPRFRDVLAMYVETWAEWRSHKKTLAKEGYTTKAGNQTTIPHPCVGMKDRCLSQLVKLARELGLTPSSATGLLLTPEEIETDPIDVMDKRGRPQLRVTSGA